MIFNSRVIWITGHSGAGKTTVAKLVCDMIRAEGGNVFWFDGDKMREALGNKWGYSHAERHELAWVYAKLVRLIAESGAVVVCSVVAMFDDIRSWNRENNSGYFEVYLDVPIATLVERDPKGLYKKYAKIETDDSVFSKSQEVPKNPDLVVRNYGNLTPGDSARLIINQLVQAVNDNEN